MTEKEIQELQDSYNKMIKYHEKAINRFSEVVSDQKKQISNLILHNNYLEAFEYENSKLKGEIESYKQQLEKPEFHVEELENKIKKLENENLVQLYESLRMAKSQIGTISKNLTVSSGSYSYNYVSFDFILENIKMPFNMNDLVLEQYVDDDWLFTRITHAPTGQSKVFGKYPIVENGKNTNPAQNRGSAITYAKRYALSAILTIATEDDTDGN